MKKIIAIGLLMFASACQFNTPYGQCIGIAGDKNTKLHYNISPWNTAWSIIGFEMVFPLVLWLTSCAQCPDGPAFEK